MTEDQFKIFQIITAILALPVPLILWYLNRKDGSSEPHKIDKYIKRFELYKKISEINLSLSSQVNAQLENRAMSDVMAVLDFLNDKPTEVDQRRINEYQKLSIFRRWFLLYKPSSLLVFIFQAFYFYILAISVLYCIAFVIKVGLLFTQGYDNTFWSYAVGMILFVALSFFMSRTTNKYHQKKLMGN